MTIFIKKAQKQMNKVSLTNLELLYLEQKFDICIIYLKAEKQNTSYEHTYLSRLEYKKKLFLSHST